MLRRVNDDVEKSPEYAAWQSAQEKQSQIQEQLGELRAKEGALATQLRSLASDPGDLVHRAQSYLDGGLESLAHREHLAKELDGLRQQIEIIERAAEIQSRAVDTAHDDYSRLVCRERYRSRYLEAPRKLIAGIKQIHEAFELDNTIAHEIQSDGIKRIDLVTIKSPILRQFDDREWVRQYIELVKANYPDIQ